MDIEHCTMSYMLETVFSSRFFFPGKKRNTYIFKRNIFIEIVKWIKRKRKKHTTSAGIQSQIPAADIFDRKRIHFFSSSKFHESNCFKCLDNGQLTSNYLKKFLKTVRIYS